MDVEHLKDTTISSVKAAVSSYQGKFLEGKPATITKFQTNYPEKYSKARELHQARRKSNHFQESRKLAESAIAEAESNLIDAKKTVKDLTRLIEESNSRAKEQIKNMEKLEMAKRREYEISGSVNSQVEKVMAELESMKRELSRLKLDMASISEEKQRSDMEAESSKKKALSYTGSVEKITKEIEEINEENVLVELARIEAIKEYEEIELKRREEAENFLASMEETRNRNRTMVEEIGSAKELEAKLAITLSDINMLENELKQVKEYEDGLQRSELPVESNLQVEEELESLKRESEAIKKELASVKDESFQFMTSMDTIRNELQHVIDETAKYKKKEEKTEMTIQNLNTKLLKAKSKLESSTTSADKAKLIALNLSHTLEQLQSEIESVKNEHSQIIEETAMTRDCVKKTETEIDLAEEKLEAMLRELKAVKSSEKVALEKLKSLIENTMNNRACKSSKITISKFEYDYLKGHASEAIEIAEKKVEASHAWVDALKASEREILMKTDLLRRQCRELNKEKEADHNDQVQTNEGPMKSNTLDRDEDDFERWRQKMELENVQQNDNAYRINKAMTRSVKRGKARRFSSPMVHVSPRTGSFNVRRKKR